MTAPGDVVAGLVDEILRAPAGLGGARLVCVDGPAGSGKTTLASRLAGPLGATVVHMDDLYAGWTGLDAGVDQLLRSVLTPLSDGEPGSCRRFDWQAGEYVETVVVERSDVILVEGCGSATRGVDPHQPFIIWVEAPDDLRLSRGLARDGDAALEQWHAFMSQEGAHFAANATRQRAHVRLDGYGRREVASNETSPPARGPRAIRGVGR